MTYPPLPEPTIIDGRRLFTAGDMRAYGRECRLMCQCLTQHPDKHPKASGQPKTDNDPVDFLRGMMGMKK